MEIYVLMRHPKYDFSAHVYGVGTDKEKVDKELERLRNLKDGDEYWWEQHDTEDIDGPNHS